MDDEKTQEEPAELMRRRLLKQRAIIDLMLVCYEELHKVLPQLDLNEIAICLFVRRMQLDGEPCHIKAFPPFLGLSSVTLSRKLNRLCEIGLLERQRKERVYYYTFQNDYFFDRDDNARIYGEAGDVITKKIMESIREMMIA